MYGIVYIIMAAAAICVCCMAAVALIDLAYWLANRGEDEE